MAKTNPWLEFRKANKGRLTDKQMRENYRGIKQAKAFGDQEMRKKSAANVYRNKQAVHKQLGQKLQNQRVSDMQARIRQINKTNKGKPVEVKKAGKNAGKLKMTEINKSFNKLKIPKNLQGTGYNDTLRKLKAKKSSLKTNSAKDKYDAIICAFENMWKSRKGK